MNRLFIDVSDRPQADSDDFIVERLVILRQLPLVFARIQERNPIRRLARLDFPPQGAPTKSTPRITV